MPVGPFLRRNLTLAIGVGSFRRGLITDRMARRIVVAAGTATLGREASDGV